MYSTTIKTDSNYYADKETKRVKRDYSGGIHFKVYLCPECNRVWQNGNPDILDNFPKLGLESKVCKYCKEKK